MLDYIIFGFGSVVTVLVGSGLTILITHKNRHLEEEEQQRAVRRAR